MATAAIAAIAPQLLSSIMGGGANAAIPTAPISGLTQEALISALQNWNKYGSELESLYGTGSTVGPSTVTQATKIPGSEQKRQAWIQMRVAKGDSLEEATKKANARAASGQGFETNNFEKYVAGGNAPGLSIKNGAVKASPQFQGGGVQTPGISQGLTDAMRQLALQSVGSVAGLPQMFGQQAANALGFQDQARNQYASMLQNMGPEGLSQSDLANLDAYKQAQLQDLGSINKANLQSVYGDLVGRGFSSSNLLEPALQTGVFDPQSRFLTTLGGNLATMQNDFLNSAASRKAQSFNNLSNGVGAFGNPASISSILQGVTDPSSAGLFDDVSGAYLASQLQQQNIGNRNNYQQFGANLSTTPTLQTPNGGMPAWAQGILGGAATALPSLLKGKGQSV